jgi:lipopolysaccharide/colanic/teichoic acid biosynthesis glycosyltransferase
MKEATRSAGVPAIAPPSPTTLALKRVVDVLGSAAGLLILSPLLLAIALVIKLDSPGGAIFRQERIGRGGRPFHIFKYRTMVAGAPRRGAETITVRADSRVTRVGAFIRKHKLDELPQFINVLRGDMSLVGPRPEVAEFMNLYSPEQRAIIASMRPGMTDYAAIVLRDESSLYDGQVDPAEIYRREIMPIKFTYYERYSQDISFFNDLKIIVATVSVLAFNHVPEIFGLEDKLQLTKSR